MFPQLAHHRIEIVHSSFSNFIYLFIKIKKWIFLIGHFLQTSKWLRCLWSGLVWSDPHFYVKKWWQVILNFKNKNKIKKMEILMQLEGRGWTLCRFFFGGPTKWAE